MKFAQIGPQYSLEAVYGAGDLDLIIWCIYLLVAIAKRRLKIQYSLYTFLQILEVNLFEKKPIILVVSEAHKQTSEGNHPYNQLKLFES